MKNKILKNILISLFIWVVINLILFLANIKYSNWQDIFIIKDKPVIIFVFLLVFLIIYFLHKKMNDISKLTEKIIYMSLFFYVIFFFLSSVYTKFTDYSFKSDWTIIILSSIPLILLVIFIILEKDFFKAKLGKVELEFKRIFKTSTNQLFYLEREYINKGDETYLKEKIKNIQESGKRYKVLIVNLSDNINFIMLRKYIYKISEVSPLQYIVFLDRNEKYLGFMTVNDYKNKFPKYSFEYLYDEIRENDEINMAERLTGFINNLEVVHDNLQRSFWEGNRIRKRDLNKLGVKRIYIEEPNVNEAYKIMVENNVPGLPVLNNNNKFKGIVSKDNIINELMLEILHE